VDLFFIVTTVILGIIIMVPFYRVLRGPTNFDRLLGVAAIAAKTMVIIVFIGFLFGRIDMFVDITLAYAILNFIGVMAIAKYVETSNVF
jgi:multicomponent Na+:H+ antiporter subunit F